MTITIDQLRNLNKKTINRLKISGIDTIEKLALKEVEDLVKIEGIDVMTAVSYIQEAIKYLNTNAEFTNTKANEVNVSFDKNNIPKSQEKVPKKKTSRKKKQKEELKIGYIKDIFSEEITQRIRFLHFKIKKLEENLNKQDETVSYDDLDLLYEYIDLLNINYKAKNQNLVINELAITPSYWDPVDKEDINIYDIMFECARASWMVARLYAKLSKQFEKEEDWENAIISMVRSSKLYKTSAHFSVAAINQNKIGKSLEPKNLEYESEQSRIFAQSLAAIKEEGLDNYLLASKLYSGLSLLSRRSLFLGLNIEKIKRQLNAQADFDMGKACHLKAMALQKMEFPESSTKQSQTRLIEDLQRKAVYYFSNSEEIWEEMLKKYKDFAEIEKGNILFNLSVVNDVIMEIDAEVGTYEEVKDIKDPEPFITVPENLAERYPKTTLYLLDVKPMDMDVEIHRKYKKKNIDKPNPIKKKEKLLSKKTAIGRTIKQLKSLYDDNDIDVNKYSELYEKYTTKLNLIEFEINKLEEQSSKSNNKKQ